MNRRILACLFGLLIIVALGIWQIFTGDTLVRQERRMKKAEKHLPIILQILADNPEFKDLKADVYTGEGGSLAISGELSGKDLEKLKKEVERTKPPTVVVYKIFPK